MKNKEKFEKEIVEIACDGKGIAVDKHTGTVYSCNYIPCSNCLFNDNYYCDKARRKWAESEYVEKPKISKRDKTFLDYLENYKYIARDFDGKLYAYTSIPTKTLDYAHWKTNGACKRLTGLDIDFPMVKWEDDEPWLIEDLKKLEVVDEYEKIMKIIQ